MKNLLLIAIAIIAVGCGAKDESTTETKPVEEKVVEVNTEEPIAETKPKLEGVNWEEELEPREGLAYVKGSDAPYTGKVYGLYENGQKKQEGYVKEGKTHGLIVRWHKNGQKAREANFKDGKLISEKYWNSKGEPVDTYEEAKAE